MEWEETRDDAKHLKGRGQTPTTQSYLAQNVNNAKIEKPGFCEIRPSKSHQHSAYVFFSFFTG